MKDTQQELGQEWFVRGLSNSEDSGGCDVGGGGEKQPFIIPPHETEKSTVEKTVRNNNKRQKVGGELDHEIHIWTERERRKKMRNMFSNLHALLPHLPPKADKSNIVDEAVNYIKALQNTLQKLQKQKLERLQSSASPTTFSYDPSSSPKIIASNRTQIPVVTDSNTRESFLADQISSDSHTNTNPNSNPSFLCNASPVVFQTWTSSNVVLNICGDEAQFNVCCPNHKLGFFTTICCLLENYKMEVVSAHVSSDFHRSIYMIQARVNMSFGDQMVETFGTDEMFKQVARDIITLCTSN